jgi:hypothetical protein
MQEESSSIDDLFRVEVDRAEIESLLDAVYAFGDDEDDNDEITISFF